MNNIKASVDFLIELDQLKSIYRKAKIKCDHNRQENSAEHSWHVAIASQILKDFTAIEIDINKVTQMLLIHDIVEIYAGDMFSFENERSKESHKLEEYKAIEKLCTQFNLTQVKIYKDLWHEFEACTTNEAKFARSVDRILPFIQNMNNKGGSWAEFGTTKQQILNHNKISKEVSSELWEYINNQLDFAVNKGWIIDEKISLVAENEI